MAYGDDDLAYMMSDVFTVPVVFGGVSATGIINGYDQIAGRADGFIVENGQVISIQSSAMPALAEGQTGTVDGVPMVIKYFLDAKAGITRIYAVKVSAS